MASARLGLTKPTGSDLIADGDNAISANADILDNAAMFAKGTFAGRPAAAALDGKIYIATDTGAIYLSDGTDWFELSTGSPVPIGGSLDFVGDSDPTDTRFLLEDGRAISRATYAELDAIMSDAGYPFGNGNGTTTFNIPDSRGRGSVGPDDMGTAAGSAGRLASNKTLGASGGAETKTLVTGNLPAHTHDQGSLATASDGAHTHNSGTLVNDTVADHTHGYGTIAVGGSGTLTSGTQSAGHTHSGTTGGKSATHTHSLGINAFAVPDAVGGVASGKVWGTAGSTVYESGFTTQTESADHTHAFTTGAVSANHTHDIATHAHTLSGATAAGGSHTHSISGATASSGAHTHTISGSTGSTGSGTAYNNMAPYLVKNKIIRVL